MSFSSGSCLYLSAEASASWDGSEHNLADEWPQAVTNPMNCMGFLPHGCVLLDAFILNQFD